MVRHKTRWLLVQLDFAKDVHQKKKKKSTDDDAPVFPSKKDMAFYVRQHLSSGFGIVADGAGLDTQVRLCDSTTRLVLLRVPREFCGMVRSSITLMTQLEGGQSSGLPSVVASILSVNGSARTAKVATMAKVRKHYCQKIKGLQGKELQRECAKLEEILCTIQNID